MRTWLPRAILTLLILALASCGDAGVATIRIQLNSDSSGTVTTSLGVASRSDRTDSVHLLLKRSDEAVYRAKSEGRDRVVVHREDGTGKDSRQSA